MSAKTGPAQRRYAGLLPIEPSVDFFRPIDLKSEPIELKREPIDLKPEVVPFPPSARKRPRSLARFPIALSMGVAAAWLWQSYGDVAKEMFANLYPQLGWLGSRSAVTAQNPRPAVVFDPVGQNVDNIATTIAADREPAPRSADQIATPQEQTTRNTGQTAISVDQAPPTKVSNVTVESQGDAASLQPAARLSEAKSRQTLAEKGKPLSATSGHDGSCFASSSAVLQNHPGAWPTWTLKAPGHVGTMCWYAAARPRGSDHRRERTPKEKEAFGTAEHELFAPVGSQGRGGSWEGGLP
jgi:hypothetical protein